MFLAALVLASKYLQDRNYSARAWSKISGLPVNEINSNEMTFLLAVNWELHITDAVFARWSDIVLKYQPGQPPSPGAAPMSLTESVARWKSIILKLTPELDTIEGLSSITPAQAGVKYTSATSPRSLVPLAADRTVFGNGSNESTPTPKYYMPSVMEPSSTAYPPTKPAPALGLLPTPRLTPQSTGYNTPAVGAASYLLGGKSSMGYAMAQASSVCTAQLNEKWQPYLSSSPQSYVSHRRSSLANSVSSMSSPESLVSDNSSRSSRSSSISSASSVVAPISSKLDVQARCRYAKLCSEKQNRMFISTVPEGYCDNGPTSSPEQYTGPVGKDFLDLSLDTPLGRHEASDYFSKDEEAARALQELHNHPRSMESPIRAGAKRSRTSSIDNSLQENVREMLSGRYQQSQSSWSDDLVRSRSTAQVAIQSNLSSFGRKRVCCATEAIQSHSEADLHPTFGVGRPGMWAGILN